MDTVDTGRDRPPRPEGAGDPSRNPGSARSFVGLLTLVIRRRRLLIGLPLASLLAAVGLSLVGGAQYTAQSRFMPERQADLSGELVGVAAQLGIAVAGAEGEESLDFYGQLLRSQELLREVALTEFEVPVEGRRDTLRGTLLELYDIGGATEAERLKKTTKRLEERDIEVSPHRAANLLVVRTRAPWPALAESLNRRILTLVNAFNLEHRQSRAAREQQFLEARVTQVEQELGSAEVELERFLEGNRRYSESPQTSFRYARLQRRVDFLQQVRTSMAQGLEQARVEAIRNTPVVTVIDRPEGTALQTAPRPVLNGILGFLLGGALAVSILLVSELVGGARRSNPEEFTELREAAREALDDLRLAGWVPGLGRRNGARDEATSPSDVATARSGQGGT